jgi:hypothetical protein
MTGATGWRVQGMLRWVWHGEVGRWDRRDACAPSCLRFAWRGGKPLDGVCFGVENPSYEGRIVVTTGLPHPAKAGFASMI